MTKLFLALMASVGVTAVALAQQQPSQPPAQGQQERMQTAPGERAQPPTRQQQQRIMSGQQVSPRTLKPEQVRMLQQALNDKGGAKIEADGRWGPQSERALRSFQQQQGMKASGRLDKETLTALGAPIPGEGEGPPPSTSPGAPPSGPEQPQQQQQQPQQQPNVPQPRQRQY